MPFLNSFAIETSQAYKLDQRKRLKFTDNVNM